MVFVLVASIKAANYPLANRKSLAICAYMRVFRKINNEVMRLVWKILELELPDKEVERDFWIGFALFESGINVT